MDAAHLQGPAAPGGQPGRRPPPADPTRVLPTAIGIIEAALDRFSAIGYEGTSMREIARSVGVKPASLYNHFTSKEEILWAICTKAITELERRQDAASAPEDPVEARVRTYVRVHVEYHAENSRNARVIHLQVNSLAPEHFAQTVQFRVRYERRFRQLLQEGVDKGVFSLPDVRLGSYAILQMGMGIASWFRLDGPLSVDELCAHYVEMAMRIARTHARGGL